MIQGEDEQRIQGEASLSVLGEDEPRIQGLAVV